MATTPDFRALLADLDDHGVKALVFDRALPELPRSNVVDAVRAFEARGSRP